MSNKEDVLRERLYEATLALRKVRAERDEATRAKFEPVAILGIGCRFPGGANSPEAFWDLLDSGRDGIASLAERFAELGISPPAESPLWAGLLTTPIDRFDAKFFEIAPREAHSLDPQQRLLLEVAWEALEDAGIAPRSLEGSRTGVYLGACTTDYVRSVERQPEKELDAYCTTGNLLCVAAGRIAYTLGLQGPALVVDTACSSSLTAIHLATRALRGRECDLALCGGVNLILSPESMAVAARTQAMAPDGRCKTFDALANGFVRGEGCGILLLKRLSEAVRDGNRIWAIVSGSAVNQDGRSAGLTAPNLLAQEALLKEALADARVDAAAIGYIETHGTGTSLGDPIEVEALRAVFGEKRADASRCLLGALKTNIGHLEAAAGVAGVIKAVLALHHERIPRNLNFSSINPRLRLSGTPLALATEPSAWPRAERPRFAGVSSFGISGTNVHLILEEGPKEKESFPTPAARSELFVLSGKSPAAVNAQAERLYTHLQRHPTLNLGDVAFSLATTRTAFEHRAACAVKGREALLGTLRALAQGQTPPGSVRGAKPLPGGPSAKVVFVYPGQGSQWMWMGVGRELLRTEPAFAEALTRCDEAIRAEAGWSVLEELGKQESDSLLERIDVAQPVLFAVSVALTALWRSFGIEPDCVIGHSMGEVAAAHVAGALTLSAAAAVICRRSRLLRRISGQGAMAMVEQSFEEAEQAVQGFPDKLSIAASNSRRETVVAGDPEALEALLAELGKKGVFCQRVQVAVASHSPQVEPLLPELLLALQDIPMAQPALRIPMWSTVSGEQIAGAELGAAYFVRNLREPVRFEQVVKGLVQRGHVAFVEMSAHPILTMSVEEGLKDLGKEGLVLGSLRFRQPERQALLERLAALFTRGLFSKWEALWPEGRRVPLPTYAWQGERYWVTPENQAPRLPDSLPSAGGKRSHPLLGVPFEVALLSGTRLWASEVSTTTHPWLSDHRVFDVPVLPAAGYVELAVAAGKQVFGTQPFELRELELERMLAVPEEGGELQVSFTEEGSRGTVQIFLKQGGVFSRHARALLAGLSDAEKEPGKGEGPAAIRARCALSVAKKDLYERALVRNIAYGPAFQGVFELWHNDDEVLGRIRWPQELRPGAWHLHPALLDACLQLSGPLFERAVGAGEAFVPFSLERVRYVAPLGKELFALCRVKRGTAHGLSGLAVDLTLMDEEGRIAAEIEGLRVRRVSLSAISGHDATADRLFCLRWFRKDSPPAPAAQGYVQERKEPSRQAWLIFADRGGTGDALASLLLKERGERAIVVEPGEGFSRLGPDRYRVAPADPESMRALLRAACSALSTCLGAVHLFSLDAAPADRTTAASLVADWERGSLSALHLCQALLLEAGRDVPRLWLVTRGTQAVKGESLQGVSQAPLWGLGRALFLENPELGCRRVDLPEKASSSNDAAALLAELWSSDGEDQVALRAEGRFVARLSRLKLPQRGDPVRFRADRSYLITGGLSGLGLSLAGWMVSRGARHLALIGRSGASETAKKAILAMESAGAAVLVRAVDVAERQQLFALFADLAAAHPPLGGIAHAAGRIDDATALTLDAAQMRTVMEPKVLGAFNLHELSKDLPLDFFLLYGAMAGLLGSPGQSNYAAANVFLDALAHHRRAQGLPALCIDWGAFSEVGLAAAKESRGRRLAYRGIESLTPDEGLLALERLFGAEIPQAAVMNFELRRWAEFYPTAAAMPLWDELKREAADKNPLQRSQGRLRQELAKLEPRQRPERIAQFLSGVIAQVLRLAAAAIDPMAALSSLGLDSLMSLEIRNRLEAELQERFSATLLYTYPTLSALTQHLCERLFPEPKSTAEPEGMATAKQAAEVIVNEVLSMSEEEAEAALLSALSVRHANEVIRG